MSVPPPAEKLGLFLPQGLHGRMLQTAARLNTRKNPRGNVRRIYERAFRDLMDALDRGDPVAFPAVRGAKDRVSVRLSKALCARVRQEAAKHDLKLTDVAVTALTRFLQTAQGDAYDLAAQDRRDRRRDGPRRLAASAAR